MKWPLPSRLSAPRLRLQAQRWALIWLSVWCLVPASARGQAPRPEAAPKRPNFVFVYTDDQRWDAMSVVQREQGDKARFPWLKTPNLDRLASEGVRFRNAFVVNSLCAPSRASYLTGRYGHLNGIVNNHTAFDPESVTHASLLKRAGYHTGYVGKWHMGSQRGQRPGFDYSASFVGQGKYVDCPIEVNGVETPSKGWVDDVSTEYALKFLRENKDQPFLLVVGFKSAHGPFDPPGRLSEAYNGEQARPVPNLNDPPPYAREGGAFAAAPPAKKKAAGAGAAGTTNMGYFRCLTAADENLGRILDTLDQLKLTDDTMVVFASDNGFYLGEHRLGDKRSAYDESLRIPLLVRYPRLGLKGRTIDALTLNIDLAPTFLDYAGVTIPGSMQGRSWRPLLEGRAGDWRKAFFYCYFFERGYRIPTVTAVRTDSAKLIVYPGHDDWTEVFDLAADPYETRNLVADAAHSGLRRDLEASYEREKQAIGFRIPEFADNPASEPLGKPLNAWVLDYHFDRDRGDEVVDASSRTLHGKAHDAPLAEGREGRKTRRFNGRSSIDVPKSPALDPSVSGWTAEVVAKPEQPNGVVLALGGQSQGFAIHLVDGKPAFTIVADGRPTRIMGQQSVMGRWVTLTAQMTADREIQLRVDGQTVAEGRLREAPSMPNDTMQVGADLGSSVLGDAAPGGFVGLIESVRFHSGLAP